ncbi:oligopeptide/dipeptide ABC transporter ATP-binding protein [Conexibacter arvalis]|uniref:Oligopeptide/dipeptide ABC transporter ATP-binding protein n=1 Tax=Conexibacter arvalis TaxID=912552 RepID=A0A840I8Z4_9ACTN|nr:oligopeptide/dipeptide ABC transporter ATP-binding protein [Conexibacter arvalis]MBB4661379.1 oligopeptide/dipeptide ABC transporter ATP-binding protein [Conexibacter arvalis]
MTAALLEVDGLVKQFGRHGARAVDGVDLRLVEGEALAIVGESGSGKTTLARCLLGLIEPSAGTVRLCGADLASLPRRRRRAVRARAQIVFQNPLASLNPRMTVERLVAEPLRLHAGLRGERLSERVDALLGDVGLDAGHRRRYPHELSGGQAQRVAIARALACEPSLLVLDEPTSALDVSVQAQILNLLADLRDRHGLAYLLISHDLAVVRNLCTRVGVMFAGRLVEVGEAGAVFAAPRHPYTAELLASAPGAGRAALMAGEEAADPGGPRRSGGCHYAPRCARRAELDGPEACARDRPTLPDGADGAACHFALATRREGRAHHDEGVSL